MTPGLTPNMNPAQPMQKRLGLRNALAQTQPATPGAQRSTLQASPAPAQRTATPTPAPAAPRPAPKAPMSGTPSQPMVNYPSLPTQPITTQNNPGILGQAAQGISSQTRQSQNTELNNAQKNLNTAQGTYGQFEGPIQQSPFYKALYNTGVESTSSAYDAADAAMKARANAAGFGYAQPVTQGAEDQLRSQEAQALAQVPQQATIDTAPLALEAARGTAGIGGEYGSMGGQLGQEALGYFDTGLRGVEDQAAINEQRKAQRGKLWSDLFNLQPGSGGDILGAAAAGAL